MDFVYDVEGGGGSGKVVKLLDGCWCVYFDVVEFYILDVSFCMVIFLGVFIFLFIRIEIVIDFLEGIVDCDIGKVSICLFLGFIFCDFGWILMLWFGFFGGWGMWLEWLID